MSDKVTVAVIGGGPGGYVAAIRAAQLGASVTLIEKNKMGGTCLNVGCIPTKALLHSVGLYEEALAGAAFGVIADVKFDFTKAMSYKNSIISKLVTGVTGLMAANKIKVIKGEATFESSKTLCVQSESGKESLTFDKIIIATGSVPATPPIPGVQSKLCIDSSAALELEDLPESMVIIGGGVIGVEIATLYNAIGVKVYLIEMMKEILPMMDGELTRTVRVALIKKGVEVVTGAKVTSIAEKGDVASVSVEMPDGLIQEYTGNRVLVSVGRRTATDSLNMDKVGIKHDRGRITVNEKMETSLPDVYAIGDCNGRIMLAHVASAQGEIAAENALGHSAVFNDKTNPSCVYTNPEFAGVGKTEEEVKTLGVEYSVGKFPLMANGKALIENGGKGIIKIIAEKSSKKILGVHMVGARATDIIAEAAAYIGLEASIDDVINTIHAHPTVAEAFREAALAVEKRAIHIQNR